MTPSFVQQDPEWEAAVGRSWWRYIFMAQLSDRLHQKQGRSIARWTVHVGQQPRTYFVKRHYRHGWWRTWLNRRFGRPPSDARLEWYHLQRARHVGIPTPRAVAVAEISQSSILQSVLVLEELREQVALHEAIPEASQRLDQMSFRLWKRGLIDEIARMVRDLHGRGLFHRDLYLCHFFIERRFVAEVPIDWTQRVVLIDFHRLVRRRHLRLMLQTKDLAQLLYSSWIQGISDEDRQRFWHVYCRGRDCRWLRVLVQWKSWLYQRSNRDS